MKKDDALLANYEKLRRIFLDRRQQVSMWGMAVLRTKGMTAWARLWYEYGEGGVKYVSPEPSTSIASRLSSDGKEMVNILTQMIWAVYEETIA